ncbi:MAG TPA: hypothetical protein VGF17_28200, partial [Phytomonospora sp.]
HAGDTVEESLWLDLYATGTGTAANTVLTINASDVDAIASVVPTEPYGVPPQCTDDAGVWTCALGDVHYEDGGTDWGFIPRLAITTQGGATGAADVTITAKADNVPATTVARRLLVAEGAAFGMNEPPRIRARVGATVRFSVSVRNDGTTPSHHPVLRLGKDALEPLSVPSNCMYGHGETAYHSYMECAFPVVLEPGASYRTGELAYRVRADALGPQLADATVLWDTALGHANRPYPVPDLRPGTAAPLGIPGAPAAPAEGPGQLTFGNGDSWQGGFVTVTSVNKPDQVALASALPRVVGETTLTVGLRNDGPAAIPETRAAAPVAGTWFTLPEGVEIVELPYLCYEVDGGGDSRPPARFVCGRTGTIMPGDVQTFDIRVRVDRVDPRERGVVKVGYAYLAGFPTRYLERDWSDNTAVIRFGAR